MCRPDHFDVVDEKNTFMRGQLGRIDKLRAMDQWQHLVECYGQAGVRVHQLAGAPGLEDMVFCANPVCVLPRPSRVTGSEPGPWTAADLVASHMNHASRVREVPHITAWFAERGVPSSSLPPDSGTLEGHGDVAVIPGRRLALGGYGGRSTRTALQALSELCSLPVVPLPLVGSPFYHLDTCLAVLDEDTLLIHPPAFRNGALQTLHTLFPRLLIADPHEAETELAVNAHGLANGTVLLPAATPKTQKILSDAGYSPLPVDVSEFHKSGGSVFCLRLDLPG